MERVFENQFDDRPTCQTPKIEVRKQESSGGRETLAPSIEHPYRFGRYYAVPSARQLFRDGRQVDLGSRAFDLLIVLLRSRGTLITKDEIIKQVWHSTAVDEGNLRFQLTYLRKALNEERDLIKTIPGRGYLFVCDVSIHDAGMYVHRQPTNIEPIHSGDFVVDGECTTEDPAKPRIAIVDDDPAVRESLGCFLKSVGFRAESFANFSEFVERARHAPADCLVLDMWMPGRNGLAVQAELRQEGLMLPVIFISGQADVHITVQAMKGGALDFLTKPIRHQELLEAIDLAVNSCQSVS
jgi:DNA-binding response OmpR family regulator